MDPPSCTISLVPRGEGNSLFFPFGSKGSRRKSLFAFRHKKKGARDKIKNGWLFGL